MLDYFYGQSGEMFSYFRVPKILFRDIRFKDLSTDAKTLYDILLDRMSLSVKNGWLDGQGRVYIIFPIQEVMDALGCADNKATKLFRELENAGLVERKRRGLGKPNLIYVKNFADPRYRNRDKNDSGEQDAANQRGNKTEWNNTEMSETDPFFSEKGDGADERTRLEEYFSQSLEIDLLLRLCPDDEDTMKLKPRIQDNRNGLDYVLTDHYYLPALRLPEDRRPIGRWGRLHSEYLKTSRPVLYQALLLSGKLYPILADLDEQAAERCRLIVQQMAQAEGITEELKAADPVRWVQTMNSIRSRAEEIIQAEMIYV